MRGKKAKVRRKWGLLYENSQISHSTPAHWLSVFSLSHYLHTNRHTLTHCAQDILVYIYIIRQLESRAFFLSHTQLFYSPKLLQHGEKKERKRQLTSTHGRNKKRKKEKSGSLS